MEKLRISTIKGWKRQLSRMRLDLAKITPFLSFWFLGFFAFASVLASAFSERLSIRTRWFF